MPLTRLLAALLLLSSSLAHAADAEVEQPLEEKVVGPFERPLEFATYTTAWGGSYPAAGVGGRIRWEVFKWVGLDLFGESLVVQSPHGFRHDHPIGFNLYVPIRLSERFRLRPLLGMCAVLSFIEPTERGAPRSDDVLLGVHAGVGAEMAIWRFFSLFAEVQGVAWAGHDRTVAGWTGAVGNDVKPFFVAQTTFGAAVHFGPTK